MSLPPYWAQPALTRADTRRRGAPALSQELSEEDRESVALVLGRCVEYVAFQAALEAVGGGVVGELEAYQERAFAAEVEAAARAAQRARERDERLKRQSRRSRELQAATREVSKFGARASTPPLKRSTEDLMIAARPETPLGGGSGAAVRERPGSATPVEGATR